MKKDQFLKLILFLYLVFPAFLSAQHWTGAVNSDWNNSLNWSVWPLNNEDIIIDPSLYTGSASSPIVSTNSIFYPALITIQNGGDLIINANLTTTDDVEVIGLGSSITINNGSFLVNTANGGRLIIDLGATMHHNGGATSVGERFISGTDAVVTINNGTVSTGDRLLMDLGGTFIQHAGIVNVAAVFAMADGSPTSGSQYILNGGALNIIGEMAFENEMGNFEPKFQMNGGSLTVNGDIFWFGVSPGSGTPRFIANGGNISINGTIQNMVQSTVNMYMSIGGNTSMNYSGSLIENQNITDSILFNGSSIITFNGNHTIFNRGVVNGVTNSHCFFNGSTILGGTGSYNLQHLTINSGKSLTLAQDLTFKGDFTKNGTFLVQNYSVTSSGGSMQTLTGSGSFNLSTWNVNNSSTSGILLSIPLFIDNQLHLINGIVHNSAASLITLIDNAICVGGSQLTFISGPLRKIGNDSFLFPVGKGTIYSPFNSSSPSSILQELTVEYMHSAPPSPLSLTSTLSSLIPVGYWTMDKSIQSDPLQLSTYWTDASQMGITNCGSIQLSNWNGTSWGLLVSTVNGQCSGNGNGFLQTNQLQTQSGLFTIGYIGNVTVQYANICFGDTYIYNGLPYSIDTILTTVYVGSNGLDSTSIISINVLDPLNVFQSIQICSGEQIYVGNSVYSQAGTYTDVLTGQNGCDSTVTTTVDVLSPVTFNQSIQICSGEHVSVGNSVYSQTGNYTDVLIAQNGCDSIVNTVLTVFPAIDTMVNITYLTDGVVLNAVAQNGAYQWLDCQTGLPLLNETENVFVPLANGTYAVQIIDGICTDTSSCILVDVIGIEEFWLAPPRVFPNPFRSELSVVNVLVPSTLEVVDLYGRVLFTAKLNENKFTLPINLPNGNYIIKITSERSFDSVLMVKE